VRRKLPAVLVCLAGAALALSSGAAAGTGGLAPEDPVTPSAGDIEQIYFLLSVIGAVVLLVVVVPLATFVVRSRGRGRSREEEGPQVRGNTRLEIAWTLVPVVLVAIVIAFVVYKAPGIELSDQASARDTLSIDVEGRRYYWQYVYPNGVVGIDRLRVPAGQTVNLDLTAWEGDVIHSFWVPALGGKFDAVPGQTQDFTFRATKPGVYEGVCGEFCGIQHAAMTVEVEVMERDAFADWLEGEDEAQRGGDSDLGEQEWEGVCSKCHRLADQGEPYIGPNLAATQLRNAESIEAIVRNGQGSMPPVGGGWSDRQMDALTTYLSEELAPRAEGGGGTDGG